MIGLNLGCGYNKIPGYHNIDKDINCKPDVNLDIEKDKLPFEDSSVDQVVANHILEHLGEGFFHLLQEVYRVCKNGATFMIEVPHYNHWTFHADPTHRRKICGEGLLLFSKKHNNAEIARGGQSTTLGLIYDVDFEILDRQMILDPYYEVIIKDMSFDEKLRLSKEINNFFMAERLELVIIK